VPGGQRERLITAAVPHLSYCHFPQLVIECKLPVNPGFAGFVGPIKLVTSPIVKRPRSEPDRVREYSSQGGRQH
jgi:hypothetical protein